MLFSATIILNINKQGKTMMKSLLFSATVAVIAMSTFATAAEIQKNYPADGPYSYDALHGPDAGLTYANKWYLGLGYSYMSFKDELRYRNQKDDIDLTGNALTMMGGYSINQYFAIEGRYSRTIGDVGNSDISVGNSLNGVDLPVPGYDFDGDMQNFAVYLKPKYSTPDMSIYALLGYGQFKMEADGENDDFTQSSIQWGLGASFYSGDHLTIFADYIRIHGEKEHLIGNDFGANLTIDAVTVGLAYRF